MITEAIRLASATTLATVLAACGAPHAERGSAASPVAGATRAPVAVDGASLLRDDTDPAPMAQGQAEFERRWAPYPSIGGQWGRGPLANADSCAACHPRQGRGALSAAPEAPDESAGAPSPPPSPRSATAAHGLVAPSPSAIVMAAPAALLRLGMPDPATPDPSYGRQFNTVGLLGRVPAEGQLRLIWRERSVVLDDGETLTLRWPQAQIVEPAYGPLNAATTTSLRVAPPLAGVGLLESVDPREWVRLRAAQARLGILGQINSVWDVALGQYVPGRFGWKASQPSLRQQAAAAFLDDIGVTSTLYLSESCTQAQHACGATETVPHPEVKDAQLAALTLYLQGLSAPAPRPPPEGGAALFRRLQCHLCHADSLRTVIAGTPRIHPYTDLLLHDMGEELADGLHEFQAQGRHWRTPPLWGLGITAPSRDGLRLLHDGRARDLQEAILWHGGEAAPMRAAYARLPKADRVILLAFLQSL